MLARPLTRRSVVKPLLFLGGLAVIVALGARTFIQHPTHPLAPAGYLLAINGTSKVSIGWGSRTVGTVLPIFPGRPVKVLRGAQLKLVQAGGRVEEITGPVTVQLPPSSEPGEIDYFRSPLAEVVAQAKLDPALFNSKIRVTSPFGVTRFLNPVITWEGRDTVTYDVAVRDPGDEFVPIRMARGVRSPIDLAQLQTPQKRQLIPDRLYEIVVRESGSSTVVGGGRFLTRPDATADALPSAPADLLTEAAVAMAKKPTRSGDACLALSRLPSSWAETELALRLRMQVASELGLVDDLAQTVALATQK